MWLSGRDPIIVFTTFVHLGDGFFKKVYLMNVVDWHFWVGKMIDVTGSGDSVKYMVRMETLK